MGPLRKSSRIPHPTERAAERLTHQKKSKKKTSQACEVASASKDEMRAQLAALTQKLRSREKASKNTPQEVRRQGESFLLA